MLEAIAALGRQELRREGAHGEAELPLEQPKASHVLALTFDYNPVVYRDVEVAECDTGRARDYFLTPGHSMGPLGSPTAIITEPDKTFRMRLLGWAKKVRDRQRELGDLLPVEQLEWLTDFLDEIDSKQEIMRDDLRKQVQAISGGRKGLLLTVKFRDSERIRWVGDAALPFRTIYSVFREEVFDRACAEGVCSVCEKRGLVSGRVGSEVFPFANFDKPGFIAGGFDQSRTWRNLPICRGCRIALKKGREYVEREMTFRFCGLQYWLIPKFAIDIGLNPEVLGILELWERRQSLKDSVAQRITGDEDEILEILSEQKDFMTLNFVFLEQAQAMERILLSADDVLPSRLKRIFEAKEYVDGAPFLERRGIDYNFGRLRPFFAKVQGGGREEIATKPFLSVIGCVLRDERLGWEGFLAQLLKRIRSDVANVRTMRSWQGGIGTWVAWADNRGATARTTRGKSATAPETKADAKQDYLWLMPLEAWMNLVFLDRLGILNNRRGGEQRMDGFALSTSDFVRDMDALFDQYKGVFYSEATKAAFTLGGLTQMLLDVQYADRKSTPFLKHLKGMRLTAQDLKSLLPKVENKLQEYQQFTASRRKLAEAVSHYFVRSDKQLGQLSVDEASFYFVLGMNLVGVMWDRLRPVDEEHEKQISATN